MEGILAAGEENVYYFDTDSIVTSNPLPNHLISKDLLGKWKLENKIAKGRFFGKKCYTFLLEEPKINKKDGSKTYEYNRFKGIP